MSGLFLLNLHCAVMSRCFQASIMVSTSCSIMACVFKLSLRD